MAIKLLYIGSWPDLINELKERDDLFELTVVANGVKTQDLLKKGKQFDGILCEAILPGMNGLSIAKMVKGYNGYSKTPFIIVGFEKDLRLFKKLFKEKSVVDDYYVTPVDVERLAKRFTFLKNYYQKYIHKRSIEGVFQRYKIPFIKRGKKLLFEKPDVIFSTDSFCIIC